MEWEQFLIDERARKLAHVQVLMSGSVTIIARFGEGSEDVSAEIIREDLRLITNIEQILETEGSEHSRRALRTG